MTPDIRRAQRQRDRVHLRAKTGNTPELWERYRTQRNLVNSMIKRAKRSSTEALINQVNSMTQSRSDWWKLIKKCVSPSYNSIPTLTTQTGNDKTYHTDDYSKATALNELFTDVTKIDDDNATFPQLTALTNARLDLIHVTLNDVKLSIHQLKSTKAPGIDKISPYILKETKDIIAPILLRLFDRSLLESKFPSVWKLSNVIPIHKKDSRSDPSNYRPISLTSTLSKVFEKSVSSHILSYLLSNNSLYEFQSGFLPHHSPTHQLTEIYHTIVSNLNNRFATSIVFCRH